MELASALIKQIILRQDIGVWTLTKKSYLPKEYQPVWSSIDSFFERYSKIPTFEEIQLDVRTKEVKEKFYALSLQECEDTDPELLLDFLKNEKAQEIAFDEFSKLIKNSKGFETAEDTVESLLDIITTIERSIDLEDGEDNMQTIDLFDTDEEIEGKFALGLNADYDAKIKFISTAYVLLGGRRGSGKSIACCNVAAKAYMNGRSSIFFSVEMTTKEILQRICSICTGVPNNRIVNKSLSVSEWEAVAKWWAGRYKGGDKLFEEYLSHRDFSVLNLNLKKLPLNDVQIEIIYDPELTLGKMRSELERKVPVLDPESIIVDYVNQILVSKVPDQNKQFDWKDQIVVSKTLKTFAQRYKRPVVSAFQTDASGEARFAKGILDSADAVFSLTAHDHDTGSMTYECTKIRGHPEISFTTEINWDSLKIGPNTVEPPPPEEKEEKPSSKFAMAGQKKEEGELPF